MSRANAIGALLVAAGMISAARGQVTPPVSPDPTTSSPTTPHQHLATQEHWGEGASGGSVDPAAFVTKAAQGGLTEVALSKAVAARTQDTKVKQFADQMVRDHSKANDELASLARSKGFKVPSALDAEHQAVVQKLSRKKGTELDAAYGKQMKEDHAKTIALFQGATGTSDTDLAAFAKKTLPTLQEHKHLAADLPDAIHSAQAEAKKSER